MSRWFRHYAGLCRDEKLVSVAIKSRQPIERVVWIWAAILESAAEIDDEGQYRLDAAEVAYFLRADETDILSVESALANAGRVDEGRVVKWGNRQFRSDRSAERVAAHRQRKRQDRDDNPHQGASQNGDVTLQERRRNSPETETELDTEEPLPQTSIPTPNVRAVAKPTRPSVSDEFDQFWAAYPSRGGAANPKQPARDKFARAVKSGCEPSVLISAAKRYAEIERNAGRFGTEKIAQAVTWLNQRRWADYAEMAAVQGGKPGEEARWLYMLAKHAAGAWDGVWGDPPGHPGCKIPRSFIESHRQTEMAA